MSKNKTKICLGCQTIFDGRRDAKTCSARCRKRYQRAKNLYILNGGYIAGVSARFGNDSSEAAPTPTRVLEESYAG